VQYRQRNSDNPTPRKDADTKYLRYNNTLFEEECDTRGGVGSLQTAITGKDGQFELSVAPGPGHLFVLGPTSDYLHVDTTLRELEGGKPGSFRYYPDAVVPLDLKAGADVPEIKVQLRRGVTLKGRVVDPDGKPVKRFVVMCRSYIPAGWMIWNCTGDNALECRDGSFELPGCDPDKVSTVYFWDRANQLGATAELSAKKDGAGSRVVRLERCGSAVINCTGVDPRTKKPDGKPLVGYRSPLVFVFAPGDIEPPNTASADRDLEADYLNAILGWKTDAEGNATVSNLIPGMTYALRPSYVPRKGSKRAFEPLSPITTFSVKSGEKVSVRHVDWRVDPDEKPLPEPVKR
jgi:hypothetical protein